jgi:hypothetical protein
MSAESKPPSHPQTPEASVRARAVLLADRITVDRAGQPGLVSTAPLCFRRDDGFAVVFRYGAVRSEELV